MLLLPLGLLSARIVGGWSPAEAAAFRDWYSGRLAAAATSALAQQAGCSPQQLGQLCYGLGWVAGGATATAQALPLAQPPPSLLQALTSQALQLLQVRATHYE